MKHIFTLLFFISISAFSQQLLPEWTLKMGSYSSHDKVMQVTTDLDGNVFVLGTLRETGDYDPGEDIYELSDETPGDDLFISKFDPDGNFLWVNPIRTIGYANSGAITADVDGNLFFVGIAKEGVDLDLGPGVDFYEVENQSIYVLKLDADGALLWSKVMESIDPYVWLTGHHGIAVVGIDTDFLGNVYWAATFDGNVDFDPDPIESMYIATPDTARSLAIQKLSASGDLIWVKTISPPGYDTQITGENLELDGSGNVIVIGASRGPIDFDPGLGESYLPGLSNDIFVLKLTNDGEFDWIRGFDGMYSVVLGGSVVDKLGNIYLSGHFGWADFDPGPLEAIIYSEGELHSDFFIEKLDASGNFIWVNTYGATQTDIGGVITTDALGENLYHTGWFYGSVDFDPSEETYVLNSGDHHNSDVFIQKLTADGDLIYAQVFGDNHGSILSMRTDASDNLFITGLVTNEDELNPYPRLTSIETHDDNDIYTMKLTECEISLDSRINRVENELSVVQDGAEYQWIDCNADFEPIPGETDQSFFPSEMGNYAVRITQGDCVKYSDCTSFGFISINENTLVNISVYPNPTQNIVQIKGLNQVENIEGLTILDVSGKEIAQLDLNANSLDLSPYPQGIYLLKIISEKETKIIRLVKNG